MTEFATKLSLKDPGEEELMSSAKAKKSKAPTGKKSQATKKGALIDAIEEYQIEELEDADDWGKLFGHPFVECSIN